MPLSCLCLLLVSLLPTCSSFTRGYEYAGEGKRSPGVWFLIELVLAPLLGHQTWCCRDRDGVGQGGSSMAVGDGGKGDPGGTKWAEMLV